MDSLGWWPFPFGITCDLLAKQRLLPRQKLGVENYPSSLLVLVPVLRVSSSPPVLLFCPLTFFMCIFAGWSAACFGFAWIWTPQLFLSTFFYTIPHLLARRYCMRRSSNCHGEGWACIFSHHKNSGQLLWHICGAGFSLGSSKPANFAMPGQCWGTRAPPSRLLLFKPSLAWFWPTPRSPGLRHSLPSLWHWPGIVPNWQFGCICSISGVEDFRSQDGASTTQLASWPERILEVLNFLVKM